MDATINVSGGREEESNDESPKNPRKGGGGGGRVNKPLIPAPAECSECGTKNTCQWHLKQYKGAELCHTCYERFKHHAIKYITTGIRSYPGEPRPQQLIPDPERCSACGTTETKQWQSKRCVGKELCNTCYFRQFTQKSKSRKSKPSHHPSRQGSVSFVGTDKRHDTKPTTASRPPPKSRKVSGGKVNKCIKCQTTVENIRRRPNFVCNKCCDEEIFRRTKTTISSLNPSTVKKTTSTTSASPTNPPRPQGSVSSACTDKRCIGCQHDTKPTTYSLRKRPPPKSRFIVSEDKLKKCSKCQTIGWRDNSVCNKCYDGQTRKITDSAFSSNPPAIKWRTSTTSVSPSNPPLKLKITTTSAALLEKKITTTSASPLEKKITTTSAPPLEKKITTTSAPPLEKKIKTTSAPPLEKEITTTSASPRNPPLKTKITTTSASPSNPPAKKLRLVFSSSSNPPLTKKVRLSPGDSHSLEFSDEYIRYRNNLFNIMPQKPQFKPLQKYSASFRNGTKLVLDLEFTNLARRLSESVDPIEFLDKIDEYSSRLTTLEEMGYDVVTLKGQFDYLIGISEYFTKKVRLSPDDPHSLEFSKEFISCRDNLFNTMPQNPQFKPLQKYSSSFRNGMKLVLDLEFTNLAQRLSESVDPTEFLDKIDGYSSRLTTLEEMGYDVVTLKGQFDHLKGISENQNVKKNREVRIGSCK